MGRFAIDGDLDDWTAERTLSGMALNIGHAMLFGLAGAQTSALPAAVSRMAHPSSLTADEITEFSTLLAGVVVTAQHLNALKTFGVAATPALFGLPGSPINAWVNRHVSIDVDAATIAADVIKYQPAMSLVVEAIAAECKAQGPIASQLSAAIACESVLEVLEGVVGVIDTIDAHIQAVSLESNFFGND